MSKKKKRQFHSQKYEKLPAICYVAIFLLFLESFLPAMKPATTALVRGLFILPALISLWILSKDMESRPLLWGVLPLLVFAFFPLFLSHRVFVLVWILLCLFLIGCTLWPWIGCSKKKKREGRLHHALLLMLVDFFMLIYCFRLDRGSYLGNGALILLGIAAALGAIPAAFIVIKWLWKNRKAGARIGWFCCFWLVSALSFLFLILQLNYVLDFHTPETCTAVTEKKNFDGGGRRSIGHHEFQITVDGKVFDLEVSYAQYATHEVGDAYTFQYYKGAFGVPFYISED